MEKQSEDRRQAAIAERAAWSRPTLRALGASQAEFSVTNAADGFGDQLS